MTLRSVSLDDKYDLAQSRVLVTGYQALIRALLMQKERDRRLGLNTAGYVIVGLFVVTWVAAAAVWHFGHFEQKWATVPECGRD